MPDAPRQTPQLMLKQRPTKDSLLIEIAGDVDFLTSVQLRDYLIDAISDHPINAVVIDLTRVTFIDSAGLSLLLEARRELTAQSRTLRVLLAAGHQPERILKLSRMESVFNFAYALDEITD